MPERRPDLATVVIIGLIVVVLVAPLIVRFGREEIPVKPQFFDPDFLQVVTVRRVPDAVHTRELRDRDGKTWYASDAALGLRHFQFDRARLDEQGGWLWLVMPTTAEGDRLLREWSAARVGETIGVLVAGEVSLVAEIREELGRRVAAARFPADQRIQAGLLLDRLRRGGLAHSASIDAALVPATATQPASAPASAPAPATSPSTGAAP